MNTLYFGLVYKATNTTTGKSYIGITTKDLETRKTEHTERAKEVRNFQSSITLW